MKQLELHSKEYQLLVFGFKEWLQILNYSKSAVKNYPNLIKELLYYLEQHGIGKIKQLQAKHIQHFVEMFKLRQNFTKEAGLSSSHINYMIKSVYKFLEYLRHYKNIEINVSLRTEKIQSNSIEILTVDEVKTLLEELNQTGHLVELRDRCLLTTLYGAGLRLSELQQLNMEDVQIEQSVVLIKHAKGNKQRVVPLSSFSVQVLKHYLQHVRDAFVSLENQLEEALFIDINGERLSYGNCYKTIKMRIKESNIRSLQTKRVYPHLFRHSIATHLYQAGMSMESLARFLGHSSLDSTMIYAHLSEQLKKGGNNGEL